MPGRVRINVLNSNNNNQSQRRQVRRPPTPPPQPRPVSRNRNLQVPMVTNIRSNSSPVRRRTKSTRSTRRIKGYKDTQSYGKKRKTMVNVAKKSKSVSQKKRGRKMSRRQRGGTEDNTSLMDKVRMGLGTLGSPLSKGCICLKEELKDKIGTASKDQQGKEFCKITWPGKTYFSSCGNYKR